MPRSVVVVSRDPKLFERVRAALKTDGRFVETGDGLHCDGSAAPLTNIYPVEMLPTEWEGWDASDSELHDPRGMSTLLFECRSPAWVAEVGRLLAERLDAPVWFVDSADTAWPSGRVDPDRILLG